MTFHVQSEVVRAGESCLADAADVRLISGVFAVVTSQFVGTSESPVTLWPRAAERLFT